MKIIIRHIVLLAFFLTSTATKADISAADWDSGTSGHIDGISVAYTPLISWLSSSNLSGEDYTFAPLSSSQKTIIYSCGTNWTLTFGSTVDGLLLYLVLWRGLEGGVDPVEYTFDAPFSIGSGLTGATVTGNTLILPASPAYYSGIIKFNNPLTSLNVISNSTIGNMQSLTIAYDNYDGDINKDGNIDLIDTILGLQIISGDNPSGLVYTDSDVNQDGKIGIAEVIYSLQRIANN